MGGEIVLIVFLSFVMLYVFGWVVHTLITRRRNTPVTSA
jgi:hypothetical protein